MMSRRRRVGEAHAARRTGGTLPAAFLALALALPSGATAQQAGTQDAQPRGFIGVGLRPTVTCQGSSSGSEARTLDSSTCERAVLCQTVVVDGPADRAGVRPGDVLLEIDGRSVLTGEGSLDLPAYRSGEPVVLTVRREGERRRFEVVPRERPERPSVMPVKVLRRTVSVTASPPRPAEVAEPTARPWVVRLAPVAAAPLPPTVQVRSDEGRTIVVQAPSGETLDSLAVEARSGSLSAWPGAQAFVTAKTRKAYDSALAEIRPVLDSLRRVQAEELRQMIAATSEARRAELEDQREQAERHEQQVRELRERQREVARRAREVREAMRNRIAEAMAAAEVTEASRIVRLAGAEFLTLSPELAETFQGVDGGLLVTRVLEGFPADELGLRAGDVVVEAAGEPVGSTADLRRALFQLAREGSVDVAWVRKGSTMTGTLRK